MHRVIRHYSVIVDSDGMTNDIDMQLAIGRAVQEQMYVATHTDVDVRLLSLEQKTAKEKS